MAGEGKAPAVGANGRHQAQVQRITSARDDHFVEIVLGQEETVVAECGKQLFDIAVGVNTPHRMRRTFLHLDHLRLGEMVAAEDRLRSIRLGMEERKNPSTLAHGKMQALDERSDQSLGNVIERRPQENDVKLAPVEIKVLLKEAVDIKSRFIACF